MAQWLDHWNFHLDRPGLNPVIDRNFFQLCFIPLLRLLCRRKGAHPGLDFVCVEILQPSQTNGVMSSVVNLPNHFH